MELCSWRQERQTAEPVRETRPTRDTTHVVACGRADVHGRVHRVLRSRQVTTHIVSGCGAFALYPWIVYPIELLHSLYRTHTLQTSRRPQCQRRELSFSSVRGLSASGAPRAPKIATANHRIWMRWRMRAPNAASRKLAPKRAEQRLARRATARHRRESRHHPQQRSGRRLISTRRVAAPA